MRERRPRSNKVLNEHGRDFAWRWKRTLLKRSILLFTLQRLVTRARARPVSVVYKTYFSLFSLVKDVWAIKWASSGKMPAKACRQCLSGHR